MIRWFVALFWAFMLPIGAIAASEPVVVTHDQLIGSNEHSFFVLRTVEISRDNIDTGYRLEFIEISLSDGSRKSGCVLREVEEIQLSAGEFARTEMLLSPCDIAARLRQANSEFFPPSRPLKPNLFPTIFEKDDGVYIDYGTGQAAIRLLEWSEIDSYARAISAVQGMSSWQRDSRPVRVFCPYCEHAGDNLTAGECDLLPEVIRPATSPFVFLRFACGAENTDFSGASFYIRAREWAQRSK